MRATKNEEGRGVRAKACGVRAVGCSSIMCGQPVARVQRTKPRRKTVGDFHLPKRRARSECVSISILRDGERSILWRTPCTFALKTTDDEVPLTHERAYPQNRSASGFVALRRVSSRRACGGWPTRGGEAHRGIVAWTVIERMHPVAAKAEKIPRSPRTCRDGRSCTWRQECWSARNLELPRRMLENAEELLTEEKGGEAQCALLDTFRGDIISRNLGSLFPKANALIVEQ